MQLRRPIVLLFKCVSNCILLFKCILLQKLDLFQQWRFTRIVQSVGVDPKLNDLFALIKTVRQDGSIRVDRLKQHEKG